MVENILVAVIVILAFYFIVRLILKRLAGGSKEPHPCQGCSGCSAGATKFSNQCDMEKEATGSNEDG
ncbi:MAG: FeoB-associated Cys-rich membrane protein [Thermodesulfobacteria bacterium]|nr:FeoB-associated Cys-rich membrane protein [Thermodesulfobacteriota bacterium]